MRITDLILEVGVAPAPGSSMTMQTAPQAAAMQAAQRAQANKQKNTARQQIMQQIRDLQKQLADLNRNAV
jgi:hypothetical protein